MRFAFISILLVTAFVAQAQPAPQRSLKVFHSDPGRGNLWKHCCFEHDLRYWFGGPEEEMDFTDLELKACVKDVAGSKWASVIYDGVRAGHHSPIKAKTHWSWGWSPAREAGPIVESEKVFIESELRKLELEPSWL
ncbi:MAG: hypothetical protein V4760_14395, partial [Bdellovibrionota bacterium]